jgi:hypothetical protein
MPGCPSLSLFNPPTSLSNLAREAPKLACLLFTARRQHERLLPEKPTL